MPKILDRLAHSWNAFTYTDAAQTRTSPRTQYYGAAYGSRPDRTRLWLSNERSIIASIYTRISIDAAAIIMKHVDLDDKGRYKNDRVSGLNDCLTVQASIDQTAFAFKQDLVMTMLDEGCACIVPVDTTISPETGGGFDIKTMRVGKVVTWYPRYVKVSVYNDVKGEREEITLAKTSVAIVENPLYAIMNEPNSTLKRLIHKLNMLDVVDEQSASGKLDLIIQLPYVIKTDARREQANQRRTDIEMQLKGSKYGIAYTDGTEKITQLNRPAENNLMEQVTTLTSLLYSQLGVTDEIMNGTADEKTMLNYWNRTIDPILQTTVESFRRSFLTKTARTQMQSVMYFWNPFRFVTVSDIADIADKFSRNEILSSNELRQAIGYVPSSDPKADQLINSNMPTQDTQMPTGSNTDQTAGTEDGAVDDTTAE